MATNVAEADDKVRLAEFPRRHPQTGGEEVIRVESSDFNGKRYLHLRTWYSTRPTGPDDDGFRPTRFGVAIREHELDDLAEAVEQARQLVHARGRSTAPEPARSAGRQSRPDSRRGQPAPSRTPPPWQDHDADDLPY